MAARALPLEGQVAGDGGGSASALGGHYGDDFGGLLTGGFLGGLSARQFCEGSFHLFGSERQDEKVGGAGAQATQKKIRFIAFENRNDLNMGTQTTDFFQQLDGLVAVTGSVEEH